MKKILSIAAALLLGLAAGAQNRAEWNDLKNDITLLVASDLGRNGWYDQQPIAATMGELAEAVEPEAVLALGDVFHYEGVRSTSDPLWKSNYENIYRHPELLVEWLPVCGNHEYRGSTQAVVDYSRISRRWAMPAKYYARTFEEKGTTLKVILLDTTPLIDKYRNDPAKYPDAAGEDAEAQLAWLERELAGAAEDWIVVAGHHPIFAGTDKSASERTDMQARVDRILRRHRVDLYVCGHIHNFQHIRAKGSAIDYVVNSSASLSRPKVEPAEGALFVSGRSGFSVLGVSAKRLTLSLIDAEGHILHTVTREK